MEKEGVFSNTVKALYDLYSKCVFSLCNYLSDSNYYDVDKTAITSEIYNRLMRLFFYLSRIVLFDQKTYGEKSKELSKVYYECIDQYHEATTIEMFGLDKGEIEKFKICTKHSDVFYDFCDYCYLKGNDKTLLSFIQVPVTLTNCYFETGETEQIPENIVPKNEKMYQLFVKGVFDELEKRNFLKEVEKIANKYIEETEKPKKKEKTINIASLLNDERNVISKAEVNTVHVLSDLRYKEIKRLLEEKRVHLPEEDYCLYGNLFEIISQFTHNKIDNKNMIDAYNQLSDLVLNMGFSSTTAEYDKDAVDAQISYISKNKDLLSSLSPEEKEIFAYCVWKSTLSIVVDDQGNKRRGLICFDSVSNVLNLYKMAKTASQRDGERIEKETVTPGRMPAEEPPIYTETDQPKIKFDPIRQMRSLELLEVNIPQNFTGTEMDRGNSIIHAFDDDFISILNAELKTLNLPDGEEMFLYGVLFEHISKMSKEKLSTQRAGQVFLKAIKTIQSDSFFDNCKDKYDTADEIKKCVGNEKEFNFFAIEERNAAAFCIWNSLLNIKGKHDGKVITGIYDMSNFDRVLALYEEFKTKAQNAYVQSHFDEIESYESINDKQNNYGFDPENPMLAKSDGDAERAFRESTYNGEKTKIIAKSLTRNSENRLIDIYELQTETGKPVTVCLDLDQDKKAVLLPYGFKQIDEIIYKRPEVFTGYKSGTPILRANAWKRRRHFVNELGQLMSKDDKEAYERMLNQHIVEYQRDKEYVLGLYKEIENDLIYWLMDKEQGLRILNFLIDSDPKKRMTWSEEAEKLKIDYLIKYEESEIRYMSSILRGRANNNDVAGFKSIFKQYYTSDNVQLKNSIVLYETFHDFILNVINDPEYDAEFFEYVIKKANYDTASYAREVRGRYYTKPLLGGKWRRK